METVAVIVGSEVNTPEEREKKDGHERPLFDFILCPLEGRV
ncbi:hypothetical protein [Thermococcus sp. GR6]|nr:hypothetical protein [Thermococcus sp. GR6]